MIRIRLCVRVVSVMNTAIPSTLNSGQRALKSINRCDDDDDDDACYHICQPPTISLRQHFNDCSNVFKGFIGSAMVGLPFAVSQAGIGLVVAGTLVIALLTDHCCVLIVKCKQKLIANMMEERLRQGVTDVNALNHEAAELGRTMYFGEVAKRCLGRTGIVLTNVALMVTQFGFSIGYFIFFGNTLRAILKHFVVVRNGTLAGSFGVVSHEAMNNSLTDSTSTGQYTMVNDLLLFMDIPQLINSPLGFAIFLLVPLPGLILISFVRDIRKLGPVSVIANTAILAGFTATLIYMVAHIHTTSLHNIKWFTLSASPILFGQITSAFEGIGTVLSIESSMGENRGKYTAFLHVSVVGCFVVLTSFGATGYLAFGAHTCQVVTANLKGLLAVVLQFLLFIGVLFTYPLQIYPCIRISELMIAKLRLWRKRKVVYKQINDTSSDGDNNIDDSSDDYDDPASHDVSLKTWQGNILRTCLVLFTAGVAFVFRSQFVYIAALTGSVGSSLLSYIIPALCHMRLNGGSRWVKAKDCFLVLFGVVGGVTGLVTTILKIIESYDAGQPEHC